MRGLRAALALGTILCVASPLPAAASTGYVSFQPPSASLGQTVTVVVDSTNCPAVDNNAASIRMVLSGPDAAPGAGPAHDVLMARTGDGTYRFNVPSLPAGRYSVSMACFPDGGLEGMVNQDGEDGFLVLAAPPATSTGSAPQSTPEPQPGPEPWPVAALLLVCATFVVGASVFMRRLSRRG